MFGWLHKKFRSASPLSAWHVSLVGSDIVTSDGQGAERKLPIHDLRRVVIATDDSGPWGADVVFLRYSDHAEPAGIFPLEASGQDKFIEWLTAQPGYRDRELAKADGFDADRRIQGIGGRAERQLTTGTHGEIRYSDIAGSREFAGRTRQGGRQQ